ncbi:hypothetical protein [Marinicella sp. W31]|uniref:hypothetical protein n=1 Tax=Marinicella sp. W31 TaxID=3023713 RepID=UPI00375838C3
MILKFIPITLCFYTLCSFAQIADIERVNVNSNGDEATGGDSQSTDISGDGNLVAFSSSATNLVENDSNLNSDIFVFDRNLNTISRVSVASDGSQANGQSNSPRISRDGRFVAFRSAATNLVANDDNGRDDVFVHDLMTGTTELVSLSSLDNQSANSALLNDISADGSRVVFNADFSDASDTTPGQFDVWVRDLNSDTTLLVSQSSDGAVANERARSAAINSTGELVVFLSEADNLIASDTNGLDDVFLRNLTTNETTRVSLTPNGEQLETGVSNSSTIGGISDDGRFVAFQMSSNDLLDPMPSVLRNRIIRHDRQTGANLFVSVENANSISLSPSMSGDGNVVTYNSPGSFLSTEAEVFARIISDNTTVLVSQNLMNEEGDDSSSLGVVSDNGQFITFISVATNLVDDDMNDRDDVFVAELSMPEDLIFSNGFD